VARGFSDLLRLGPRRPDPPPAAAGGDPDVEGYVSKGFARLLAALTGREAPVIVDLGPVVGSNVAFYGERLGCKLYVEDLFTDLDRHARAGQLDELATSFASRLRQPDASVDAILCWDLFDYLPRPAAQAIARETVRSLKPGGLVFGFFGTLALETAQYTRFVIVDDGRLRHRITAAPPTKRQVFQNRDIQKMFDPMVVSDSFLLKTNTREILLRKP
jgi:Methyltransferase domain